MPEEVICITFIAMVAVIMINIVCAIDHRKAIEKCEVWERIYRRYVFDTDKAFFEELGAYEAPEGKRLYLDLEGGIRLVIFEGEIEGWYKP